MLPIASNRQMSSEGLCPRHGVEGSDVRLQPVACLARQCGAGCFFFWEGVQVLQQKEEKDV